MSLWLVNMKLPNHQTIRFVTTHIDMDQMSKSWNLPLIWSISYGPQPNVRLTNLLKIIFRWIWRWLIQRSTFYIIKKKPKRENLLLPQTIKTCLKSVSYQTKKETDSHEVILLFQSGTHAGTRTDRSQAVHGSLISIKSTTHQHRNYILYTGIQMQKPTKLKLMSRKVSKLKTTTNR